MRRSLLLLVALAALGLACAGCLGRRANVRVEMPGVMNSVGEGAAHIRPGRPVSIGSMDVCLNRPGSATIDDVTLVGPVGGGIKVDDWTLVRHPRQESAMFIGTDRRDLRSYGRPLTHHVVDVCRDDPARFEELVVQVERVDSDDAGFHEFRVDWSSDDDHGSLLMTLSIALCNGDADGPSCDRLGLW
jgi:hypothetical protein